LLEVLERTTAARVPRTVLGARATGQSGVETARVPAAVAAAIERRVLRESVGRDSAHGLSQLPLAQELDVGSK